MIGTPLAPSAQDHIAGVAPERVYEPASIDDLIAVVRESARARDAIVVIGGGTELELGAPPQRLDAVIRTRCCAGLVEYAPLDQVITVEAGMTLAQLQHITGEHQQRLAIDAPQPQRATIGGIIAANTFGPLRTRFGSIRDVIVGVSLVRADGTLVRGGGKVVKNVAGFDIPRLVVGSLGSLGVIATATLRLHPLPETAASVYVRGLDAAQVRALARQIRALQLEPSVMIAQLGAQGYGVTFRFEGFAAGVSAQIEVLASAAGTLGHAWEVAAAPGLSELEAAHDAARVSGDLRLKFSALPATFENVHERVIRPLTELLAAAQCVWYPYAGCGFIAGSAAHDPGRIGQTLRDARAVLEGAEGSLVLHAAPPPIRALVEPWGTPPSAFAVMQRLKDRFDPEGRLCPGRFVGGL